MPLTTAENFTDEMDEFLSRFPADDERMSRMMKQEDVIFYGDFSASVMDADGLIFYADFLIIVGTLLLELSNLKPDLKKLWVMVVHHP